MKLELSKIEAPTLEEAYTKASQQLCCSITDLEFEVVQNPSKGFLGFGKKVAIIVAVRKPTLTDTQISKPKEYQEKPPKPQYKSEEKRAYTAPKPTKEPQTAEVKEEATPPVLPQSQVKIPNGHFDHKFSQIENGFFDEKKDISEICKEIEEQINRLFSTSCFDLERISVTTEDDQTVLVKFSGADSALLIGKEGYRYNALAYLLFNWINPRYRVAIKLEIAEFLQNQEEMVRKYIESVVYQVKANGYGRTKPLDGVLLQIAVKELRVIFPDKYVGVKSSDNGARFIVINEFARK